MQDKYPARSTTFLHFNGSDIKVRAAWTPATTHQPGTVDLDLSEGEFSLTQLHLFLSWEQARELRHQLSVAIEAGISSGVSVEEAVQRG